MSRASDIQRAQAQLEADWDADQAVRAARESMPASPPVQSPAYCPLNHRGGHVHNFVLGLPDARSCIHCGARKGAR